jgi:hypothetical protein
MVQLQKMLLKVSPELEHRFQRSEIKPKIKLFEGRQGVLSIYEDLLTVDAAKDGEIFIFSARQKVAERFPTLLADLDRRRAAQGIWVRTIYSRQIGEDLPDSGEDKKSLHTFVTISAQKFPFPGNVHIYQNKVAFIALQRQLIGVVIENRNVANTYRTIFRLAWRGASELMKRND